jgi:hypothetical protein
MSLTNRTRPENAKKRRQRRLFNQPITTQYKHSAPQQQALQHKPM